MPLSEGSCGARALVCRGVLSLAALAGAAVVAALRPAAAAAVAPGENGAIAFVRGERIHVLDSRSGRVRRLTRGRRGSFDAAPAWSPDARTIAFTRHVLRPQAQSFSCLYTVAAAGGERTRIVCGKAGLAPSWSPRGDRIAFVNASDGRLRIAKADGSRARVLPVIADSPAWSPDGRTIAFDREDIFLTDPAGRRPVRLTRGPARDHSPSWSPDGRWISFVRDLSRQTDQGFEVSRDVLVMRADGGLVGSLGLPPGSEAPAWSPDGTRLVFSCELALGARINRDLCAAEVLTTPAGPRASKPRRLTFDGQPDHSPDWQRRPSRG